MEILAIIFTLIIIVLSVWILSKLIGRGGFIGKALSKIGYGTVIIGFSQVIETSEFNFFNIGASMMQLLHHFIFIIGLSLIAWGFKDLMDPK